MKREFTARIRRLAALWILGGIALAVATWVCFQFGVRFATTAFVYLILIVSLSLLDSFVSSAIFSIIAVGCLDLFFTEPRFSLRVDAASDIIALIAFLIASLAVTGLVRRVNRLGNFHREQAELLDLTHDPFFVRDMNDAITYWNRGAEEVYGWRREEALGQISHRLLRTIFPSPLEEISEILLKTGRWEGELIHTRRDGTGVVVASRWSLQRDQNGRPLRTLETNNDITERNRAEQALRRTQETFLAEAQQLSHAGSFGWNTATEEIFWSEESYRIFGYDPSTKPTVAMMLDRVHPDDLALVREVIDRAAREREDFDLEHRLLMPDGAVKHLHVVAHAVKDGASKLQFMGALMDITARKQAESALRDSEQRYRHLFRYMPIALWQLDARGVTELFRGLREAGVTDFGAYLDQHPEFLRRAMDALVVEEVNERTLRMFGVRDVSELAGSTARYWQASPDTFRRAMEARFRGEPFFEEETKIVTPSGRIVDVLFAAARPGPISDLGISLVGLVDITERVQAQEMLQRLQAEFAHAARISVLGELAASIAHEVNQPLAAMRTNTETALRWLNRPEPNAPKARELMQRIVDDALRASNIIARIRAMAAGRAPQQAAVSLHDVIEESMVFLRHELQSKGVIVSLDLAPALPRLIGDRTQLQQVIVNLVINAVYAVEQSGTAGRRIIIRTKLSDPDTLCCMIEDSGPGIPPELLSQLFDNFFTTKQAGMGMGLAISRSIIQSHGGHIRADNKSVLGGARFSFALPVEPGTTRIDHPSTLIP
jgi:PAS domain S-box-containing protein